MGYHRFELLSLSLSLSHDLIQQVPKKRMRGVDVHHLLLSISFHHAIVILSLSLFVPPLFRSGSGLAFSHQELRDVRHHPSQGWRQRGEEQRWCAQPNGGDEHGGREWQTCVNYDNELVLLLAKSHVPPSHPPLSFFLWLLAGVELDTNEGGLGRLTAGLEQDPAMPSNGKQA